MIRSDLFPLEDRLMKERMSIVMHCSGERKKKDNVNPRVGGNNHKEGREAFNSCIWHLTVKDCQCELHHYGPQLLLL